MFLASDKYFFASLFALLDLKSSILESEIFFGLKNKSKITRTLNVTGDINVLNAGTKKVRIKNNSSIIAENFNGMCEKATDADKLKDYLREIGFKGAFIVAFLDGKQISTKDALNLQYKISQNE